MLSGWCVSEGVSQCADDGGAAWQISRVLHSNGCGSSDDQQQRSRNRFQPWRRYFRQRDRRCKPVTSCLTLSVKYVNDTVTDNLLHNQTTFLPWRFGLYQRTSSEKCCLHLLLLVLTTAGWKPGKKSVVCVAQCVAALVPVYGSHVNDTCTLRIF